MDVTAFCTESRVLVVAGKGGVGKTTVAASLARMAADAGLSVLLVDLEGKAGLRGAFGSSGALEYEEEPLHQSDGGSVRGRRITPDDALLEYLADHGLHRVSKRLVSSGVIDVVATAIPGIRDVLVLGKVKQLERDQVADLIVLDAPATGHAVTFLTSAGGLVEAARSGPIRAQATDVVEFLGDPARCRVMLVTLPEELPVSETIEAAYQLEDRVGIQLGPIVVNGYDEPPAGLARAELEGWAGSAGLSPEDRDALDAARHFRLRRHQVQVEQLTRLGNELPLPQLRIPELSAPTIGPDELATLAGALAKGVANLVPEPPAR